MFSLRRRELQLSNLRRTPKAQSYNQAQLKKGEQQRRPTWLLKVYFGTPNMFITLWFGLDYETNPPLGTLMIYKFIFVCAFGSVMFLQDNMDTKDGFTTSSKEQMRSPIHV
jgi:hypothetical protein